MCYTLDMRTETKTTYRGDAMTDQQIQDLAYKIDKGILTRREAEQIIEDYHKQ